MRQIKRNDLYQNDMSGMLSLVRPTGKGLNSQFNSLSAEEWSQLFNTLEQWERHLAQLDSESLRCDHEHFRQ